MSPQWYVLSPIMMGREDASLHNDASRSNMLSPNTVRLLAEGDRARQEPSPKESEP